MRDAYVVKNQLITLIRRNENQNEIIQSVDRKL